MRIITPQEMVTAMLEVRTQIEDLRADDWEPVVVLDLDVAAYVRLQNAMPPMEVLIDPLNIGLLALRGHMFHLPDLDSGEVH